MIEGFIDHYTILCYFAYVNPSSIPSSGGEFSKCNFPDFLPFPYFFAFFALDSYPVDFFS